MTPQELRAAAERQQHFTWPPGCCQCDAEVGYTPCEACFEESQVQLLARHVLATVRADDAEPVTRMWLETLGGQACGFYVSFLIDFPSPIDLRIDWPEDGECVVSLWQANADDPNGRDDCVTLPSVRTRGQVRSLLRALGIEVSNHA